MEIKGNTIHRTYNRCVTIHASHYVQVIDNVAFDNLGHCFFLEDGGEKYTYFEGNLGISIKLGFVIPSDKEPTTFWITSPLTYLINNTAAGSHSYSGVGFWYLFPDKPVGPSEPYNFFQENEAKRTPILTFYNNVAHSNGKIGLAFFRRLAKDHGIDGCSTYTPGVDPLDKRSEYSPILLDTFTAYKNRKRNVEMRSAAADLVNFRLSDSLVGVKLVRNMLGGYQRIVNSTIIGESPNLGVGSNAYLKNETTGRWYISGKSNRTLPFHSRPYWIVSAVVIEAEGPSHLENVRMLDFRRNQFREAAAIKWKDDYIFHNGATSSASGLEFNFADPDEGLRMLEIEKEEGKGDSTISMRDLDGSLTGEAGSIVTQIGVYYSQSSDCEERPGWNLQVCKNEHYAKMYLFPNVEHEDMTTFLTYHDLESDPTGKNYSVFAEALAPHNFRMSYALPANKTGDKGYYLVHWTGKMEDFFGFKMSALEEGEQLVLGYCLPMAANETELWRMLLLDSHAPIIQADSLEELMTGETCSNVYFDLSKSILYRRFQQTEPRHPEFDLSDCIGGITSLDACQFFRINLNAVQGGVDLFDGDCTSRIA